MRRDAAPAFAARCRSLPPSEIVLERLIDTLVVLAVEHAWAEGGLLILPRGNELRIEAEATTGRETVTLRLRREGVSGSELPESVLHYVIRTQEPAMLDDASAQNLFSWMRTCVRRTLGLSSACPW